MPRNVTRSQIVANAVQARRPSGGTSAPRGRGSLGPAHAAPRGIGIGQGHPAPAGVGIGQGQALPGGPAATPGSAAPAVAPAPTPWNSSYEQTVSGAQKKYLDAEGNYDLAEQTAKQDFGLDPGFNDYQSNPNSRAALLEQTYLQHNRGITNSAGLQLYSGSTSNRLGSNRLALSSNRDALAKTYRDALGEIGAGRVKAAEEKAETDEQAEWDRIGEAEKVPLDPGASPGPGKAKAKPQPKARAKAKPPQPQRGIANNRPAPARKKGK